jgi:replication-associated recombination protein RarA
MAAEDIGLADPRALRLALDAAEVYERLGSPEGELALAECVIYLAIAAKSNAVYKAFNEAKAWVKKDGTRPVPMHLRNAPTQLMKNLDYGKGYRYAHDEPDAYAAGALIYDNRGGAMSLAQFREDPAVRMELPGSYDLIHAAGGTAVIDLLALLNAQRAGAR